VASPRDCRQAERKAGSQLQVRALKRHREELDADGCFAVGIEQKAA
jgi:hypothetical protein